MQDGWLRVSFPMNDKLIPLQFLFFISRFHGHKKKIQGLAGTFRFYHFLRFNQVELPYGFGGNDGFAVYNIY